MRRGGRGRGGWGGEAGRAPAFPSPRLASAPASALARVSRASGAPGLRSAAAGKGRAPSRLGTRPGVHGRLPEERVVERPKAPSRCVPGVPFRQSVVVLESASHIFGYSLLVGFLWLHFGFVCLFFSPTSVVLFSHFLAVK